MNGLPDCFEESEARLKGPCLTPARNLRNIILERREFMKSQQMRFQAVPAPTPRICGLMRGCNVLLACVGASLLFSGCEPKSATGEISSPKEMGTRITELVPKGTPIAAAKEFMEKEGFVCVPLTKSKWKGKGELDYLQCKREDGTPPIKRLWEVAVFHDGKKVTAVDVRSALLYP